MVFNLYEVNIPCRHSIRDYCMVDILYKKKYMKTLRKTSFLLLTVVLVSGSLLAQSADDVVSKYVDAIGGHQLVSSINSIVIESNVTVMGSDVPSTTHILNGKRFRTNRQRPQREVTYPQLSLTISHIKVEFNTPVDPAIFDMPK